MQSHNSGFSVMWQSGDIFGIPCRTCDDHVMVMWWLWWSCDGHVMVVMIMWWSCDGCDDHVMIMWWYVMYSGKLWGRKLSRISEKYDFHGENFHRLLAFTTSKDGKPTKLCGEIFADSHKTVKFAKVFRYTVYIMWWSCDGHVMVMWYSCDSVWQHNLPLWGHIHSQKRGLQLVRMLRL